jgi:hypothetical protein
MVVLQLPSPRALNTEKIEQLMCNKSRRFDTLLSETQQLKQGKFLILHYSYSLSIFIQSIYQLFK